MKFGVSFQSHIGNSWKHAVLAEQVGFSNAWFVDTQMLASDVYACMSLAAVHTSEIQLGTAVAVAGTRIAPVIAHSIATVNQLAPGRVILGLGTGHTAWRVMNMTPTPIRAFRHTVDVCRKLLRGDTVEYKERGKQSEIRFLDLEHGYINTNDHIPIYLAASYPKALAVAGELGDGLITVSTISPAALESTLARAGKEARPNTGFPVVTVAVSCVLQNGESLGSSRVLARVGPRIAVGLHYAYETVRAGGEPPDYFRPYLTEEYCRYLDERWDDIHATHSRFLHPGEEQFITPPAVDQMSVTGTREEVIDKIRELEAAGLTQFVISPPWGHVEESIVEFGREIVAHY